MAKVVYVGPSPAVDIVGAGRAVNGEPFDVPAELAKSLCEQDGFEAVGKSAVPAAPADTPQEDN